MSLQPSIASYFGKRKRINTDDVYRAKILKTGEEVFGGKPKISGTKPSEVFSDKITNEKITNEVANQFRATGFKSFENANLCAEEKPKVQTDIRESLRKCQNKQQPPFPPPSFTSPVKFQLMGSLSPAKKSTQGVTLAENELKNSFQSKEVSGKAAAKNLTFGESDHCPTDDVIESAKQLVSKIKQTQKILNVESNRKKELSLKEIKDKIKRSSKLSELKKSINKINEHAEELIELEKKKLTGTRPKLSKFKTIEVEVPSSPKKNGYYGSPAKPESGSPARPAHERFAALVDATSSLPLPFGFQRLFELFKAVDTVCSMMINRGEVVTFNKLKPAVEEMTRKNFTLRHLGQMATVYPGSYSFHQEKLRNFGSTSKVDKYELVVTPTLPSLSPSPSPSPSPTPPHSRPNDRCPMTPRIIKARRETFHDALLERTKDFHEDFLKTLDPPITINRKELKRWHPNFSVDLVPDVNPQELPQPPTSERPSTAKEILERAKDFLGSNARLHRALEAAARSDEGAAEAGAEAKKAAEVSLEVKEKVDARLSDPLKGISKSLLEKVRARQAAKALDAMRMTPEREKEILTYARLPDIARIVRTVFINEQKGVLPMEVVLEKVQFSHNRNLTLSEIESHIRLLTEKLGEWLSVVHIRNSDYLKINRSIDVTSVVNKLNKIVEMKKQETKSN